MPPWSASKERLSSSASAARQRKVPWVHQLAQAEEERHRAFSAWLEPALKEAAAYYEQANREHWPVPEIERRRSELFTAAGQLSRRLPDGPPLSPARRGATKQRRPAVV